MVVTASATGFDTFKGVVIHPLRGKHMNGQQAKPKGDALLVFLYDKIVDYQNLESAYTQQMRGYRKYRKDNIVFDIAKQINMLQLWNDLKHERYMPGEYLRFRVYEPKERWVSAPRIRDKIVQFAVHRQIHEHLRTKWISSSFGCIDERGTQAAVDHVQRMLRQCEQKNGTGWIVKVDASKFFYSIDRDILKRILLKYEFDDATYRLLCTIIDSSPEGEKGLPLGNVTSQDLANVYLNEIDQYAKRYLGIKWYCRYMDDIIAVVPTREAAQQLLFDLKLFMRKRLKLEAHPKKSQFFPLQQGVNAYGFKIYTTHRLVRDDSKRRMKRRMKAMDRKLKAGLIEERDVVQSVNAWLGHARHSNSYNLARKIFAPYPYIRVEGEHFFLGKV